MEISPNANSSDALSGLLEDDIILDANALSLSLKYKMHSDSFPSLPALPAC